MNKNFTMKGIIPSKLILHLFVNKLLLNSPQKNKNNNSKNVDTAQKVN